MRLLHFTWAVLPSLLCLVSLVGAAAAQVAFPGVGSPLPAGLTPSTDAPKYVPGEVVVMLKPGVLPTDLATTVGRAVSSSVADQSALESESARAGLRSLLERYRPEVEPIGRWKNTNRAGARSLSMQPTDRWNAHVNEMRSKFAARAQRAPRSAVVPDLSQLYLFKVAEEDTLAAARDLAADPHVEFAHPNYVGAVKYAALPAVSYVPDDEFVTVDDINWSEGAWGQTFPDLWGLRQIQALEAWDLFPDAEADPGSGIVVAVLDTGVDYTHPDLAANIWINAGEDLNSNGVVDATDFNGIDDDANGYVDDLRGWDFASDDNDPKDDDSHGTHVAGTIAAVANNSMGIAGVSPNAQIMPLKGLSSLTSCADITDALLYQTDMGADVSNNSWGYIHVVDFCPSLALAVQYSYANGVVFVVAAGNLSTNFAAQPPQNLAQSIVVAASTETDAVADFSSFGSGVDVAAPGGSLPPDRSTILSALFSLECVDHASVPCRVNEDCPSGQCLNGISEAHPSVVGGEYLRIEGTSMAAPHVAGTVALLLSQYPSLTVEQVRTALRMGADDAGVTGWDEHFGFGRLNALASLQLPPMPGAHLTGIDHEGSVFCDEVVGIDAIAGVGSIEGWSLRYRKEGTTSWTGLGSTFGDPPATVDWNVFELPEDSYTLELQVADSGGGLAIDRRRVHRRPYDAIPGAFVNSNPLEQPVSLAAIDFDRDGDNDLVVCGIPFTRLWKNDGSGKFTVDETSLPLRSEGCTFVGAADLNGDGRQDLVLSPNFSYTVISDSTGGYTDHTIPATPDANNKIAIGDIDGDSDLDLLVPVGQVLVNSGDGINFVDTGPTSAPWWNSGPCPLLCTTDLADLDLDGDLDLIVDAGIGMNDGTGNFSNTAAVDAADYRAVGDVNGDGYADMVFLDLETGMTVRINDGTGSFTAPAVSIPGTATPLLPGHTIGTLRSFDLIDVDLDGDRDIVRLEFESRQVVHAVFLNDGTGSFVRSPPHNFYGPQGALAIRQLNVDADGGLDLVIAGSYLQAFRMRYGDFDCTGDCNNDGAVHISELISGVNIANGDSDLSACPGFDPNRSGDVSVPELIVGLNNAGVGGCRCTTISQDPPVMIDAADIQGIKGGSPSLAISTSGGQGNVAAIQADLLLEDSVISIADPDQDCSLAPGLSGLQLGAFEPAEPAPTGFTRVRLLVFDEDLALPVASVPDGPVVSCVTKIGPSAQPNVYRIPVERPRVSDLDGRAMGAYVNEGAVTVCPGCGCP